MRRIMTLAAALLLFISSAFAQMSEQEKINREIFNRTLSLVGEDYKLPMNELVVKIGKSFIDTPYVGFTLESEPEQLSVFLDKTDCILYVEMCTCLALTCKGLKIVQAGDGDVFSNRPAPSVERAMPSYELFIHNVQNMRYRLGVVDGYASRVHYTSEWLLQNATNGILYEFTSELGDRFDQKFNYMSTHPDSYKQLKNNEKEKSRIEAVERHVEAQAPYFYISQEKLRDPEVMSRIHTGDIITFISPTYGLDLAHVAIACEVDGQMHFLHASSAGKKVMLEPQTLAEYAKNGLRISRLR